MDINGIITYLKCLNIILNLILNMNYHKVKYENVTKKVNMYSILNLDYKKIDTWIPRNYPKESIKEYYNLNYLHSKTIQLLPENKNLFNISKINKYNIFYNLHFGLNRNINIKDYIIIFSIRTKNSTICQISNKGSELFNNKVYNDYYYNYYHINLFECLEYKFLCLNYHSDDIYIHINIPSLISNYYILISEVSLIEVPKIKKFSEFYFFEKLIRNPEIINNNEIELNINNFCYSIYFTCYYNNKPFKISNISLNIDNYEIKSNSSKIIINNFDNIHLIEFFPTNDYDFIKKNNIYGININNINIKINPELPINLQDCDFFISIGIINYRILKINPQ